METNTEQFQIRFGIRLKITIVILLLLVITFSFITYLRLISVRERMTNQMAQDGAALTRTLSKLIVDALDAQQVVDEIATQKGIVLIGIYDTQEFKTVNHSDHTQIGKIFKADYLQKAVETGKIQTRLISSNSIFEIVQPIEVIQDSIVYAYGIMRVGLSTDQMDEAINASGRESVYLSLTSMLSLAGLLFLVLRNSVINPIQSLVQGTTRLSAGDFSYKIKVKTRDELGKLANSFNNMALSLKENIEAKEAAKNEAQQYAIQLKEANIKLEEWNKELDRLVQERSHQLMASEKMATVGTLAGGVAHEINNPLGAILLNVQMLKMEVEDDYQMECLEIIEDGTRRCKTIVEKLLTYSRQGAGELEELNLNKVLEEALILLEPQLTLNNVELKREFQEDLNLVQGNPVQLEQVFTNIIINAQQAIQKTLNANKEEGKITLHTYNEKNEIIIEIIDDGCGISENELEKIFEPFYTIGDSYHTNEVAEGKGLGLATAQGIIEKHQGKVYATSELDKGSIFYIRLPIKN